MTIDDIYLAEVKRASTVDEKFAKILLSDAIRKFTLNCLLIAKKEFILSKQQEEFELTMGGSLKIKLFLENGELKIVAAMNGYGDAINTKEFTVFKISNK
jgi:hypothetical protein